MSYADYVTFEKVINDIIQEKALSKEAIQEFYDNFADEFNNWNNGRITEETTVNERGSVGSRSESSEGLLPTEQLSDNRGIETDISAEADERADNKGVPASEESIITEIETAREQVDTNPSDAQKEAQIENQGKITAEPVSPQKNGGKTEVKLPQSKSNAKNKKRAADIKQARYELMDAKRELSVAQATNSGYTPEEVEEKKKRVEEAESKLKDLTNKVPDKEVSQNTDRIGKKGEQKLIHQDLIKSIYVKSLADMNESLKNIKENIKNEQEKEEPNSDLLEKLNIDKSALDRKIKRTKSVINKKVSIMSEGEFMLMNIINKNQSLPFSQMSENDVLNSVDENEINDILDKYPDYIKELSDNGVLQKEFNEASIQDEINIRNAIESSGYEVEDLLDTSEKKKSQKKNRISLSM